MWGCWSTVIADPCPGRWRTIVLFADAAERSAVCAFLLALVLPDDDDGAGVDSDAVDDAMLCIAFILEGGEVRVRRAGAGVDAHAVATAPAVDPACMVCRLSTVLQLLRSPRQPDVTVQGLSVARPRPRVRSEVWLLRRACHCHCPVDT